MSGPERIDVLAILDAFAADRLQVCCGNAVGGGCDEDGNGEPPQCCGQPFDSNDLLEARAATADLLEALARIVSYYDMRRHNGRLPSFDSQAECEHEVTMFGEARAAIAKATGGQP